MNARKRGLGRGLDALLGVPAGTANATTDTASDADRADYRLLGVDLIEPGRYQPRQDMKSDSLADLADSIRAQGVVQPIIVRPLAAGGRYEIIAGERRWRAAQLAGLAEVPVIVRRVDDESAMSMALIENIQRESLNPLEEAQALHRLVNEFGMTHQRVAEAVGRSRAAVSNLLRLLDLSPEVKRLLAAGALEMGHARALLGIGGALQKQAAERIASRGLSVREAEHLVRRLQEAGDGRRTPRRVDPDVARLETDLSERLGARVALKHGAGGAGSLTIRYNSLDELEGILEHIK
ncbi:MAG: ParB/RepB/Spo0J family partition protein [Gammaproteobacteria bacterium]|nr:ParB/RepB/Spo0J family partition protein [Gammaproteobacteria bacterium]